MPRSVRSLRSRRGLAAGGPSFSVDRGSLAVMFILLFAMGLGATAGLLGGFQTLPPPTTFGSFLPAYVALLVTVGFLALVVAILLLRFLRRKSSEGSVLSGGAGTTLLAFLMVVVVVVVLLAVSDHFEPHRTPPAAVVGPTPTNNSTANNSTGGSGPSGGSTNNSTARGAPASPNGSGVPSLPPLLLPLAGGVVLSIVLVPLAGYLIRRGRPPARAAETGPPELVRALEQAVAHLDEGARGAARQKIVEAYGALLGELDTRGVAELDLLTPREIELVMEQKLALSSPSAHGLRELFEEARYSEHPMSDAHAESARQCLTEVLEQLKRSLAPSATKQPTPVAAEAG